MNSYPQTSSRSAAFTLVELLTVIAITAILMGLLFPAIGIVKDQARKAEAKTACAGIVAAVKAYNTEYGKYPVGNFAATTGDYKVGANNGDNTPLFNILRAKEPTPTYNPRKIVFFEGKAVSNTTAPKSGFADTGATGGPFYDPWGGEYGVIMDADYDNQVIVPYTDFASPVQTGCVAYSMGKDGKLGNNGDSRYKSSGTPSDDVISWQ